MYLQLFLPAVTIWMTWLFVIWKSNDRLNTIIKMIFLVMSIWGLLNALFLFGYMIKV